MAEYDEKTGTWRADVSIAGVRYRKRGFIDKNIAEIWEGKQRWKHERRLVDLPTRDDIEIERVFAEYIEYVREHKRQRTYLSTMRAAIIWRRFCERFHLRVCSDLHARTWDEFRRWRGNKKPATLNKDLLFVRGAFEFARKRKLVAENHFADVDTLPTRRLGMPRFFPTTEIADIEAYAAKHSPRFYDVFVVLVRTGLRVGELCALTIRNVDLVNRVIVLDPDQTKGNRLRVVPFGDMVFEVLARLANDATAAGRLTLFVNRAGNPQSQGNLYQRILTALKYLPHIDSTGVSLHTCRKTFISHAIMGGADPAKIMAIVGHQQWSTMRVYLALSPAYLAQQINLPF